MNDSHVHIPKVRVRLTILSESEGGRKTSIYDQDRYRPHIVIGDPSQRTLTVDADDKGMEEYLGVRFIGDGRFLLPGQQHEVELALIYHPHVGYGAVTRGATFTVREGHHVVAFGEVISDVQFKKW